jgi:hypothetical protein
MRSEAAVNPARWASGVDSPIRSQRGGKRKAPADAGLEVTVTKLDGADRNALFDARQFSPEDQITAINDIFPSVITGAAA